MRYNDKKKKKNRTATSDGIGGQPMRTEEGRRIATGRRERGSVVREAGECGTVDVCVWGQKPHQSVWVRTSCWKHRLPCRTR